jgi:predicted regulator of Ras-like GTPase activity (Roadblock/LC7/MglB family)
MQSTAQLEERISKCEEILSDNPESLIFAALSDAYRKIGDLSKAFHVCGQGLRLHPDYGPGHLVMARINMERGMYTEAEKELASAEQADGKTRTTELLLAQVYMMKGQLDKAKMVLDKLRAANPENQTVGQLLDAIREQSELGKLDVGVMTVHEHFSIEKVADLRDGMHYLKSLPGVMGAVVVGDDGVVVESKLNPNLKGELVGAVTATTIRCVREGASSIGFGEVEQTWIDTKGLGLWIMRFSQQTLALCCVPDANLGALRMRVNELLDHLHENPQSKGER